LFGRKSRAERLKAEAQGNSLSTVLVAAYGGTRPLLERLLYDDDLRDNIRIFIESTRNIIDELSDEDPSDVLTKLWDNKKVRKEVEAAVEAAQEGTRRIRGQKVKQGGGSGKLLLVLLLAGGAFLFLNPKTGPEARRIAGDAFSALGSGS
jgi:hypothetical protein